MSKLLEIKNLNVWYHQMSDFEKNSQKIKTKIKKINDRSQPHKYIIKDFSMTLDKGEILGLIGPSGCGKTTVAWSIMGMIERMGGHVYGKITFEDTVILNGEYKDVEKLWWQYISIVPQASMSAFNPSLTIRQTLVETVEAHKHTIEESSLKQLMDMVCLKEEVLDLYPHEMSGGMKQRAAIATAMCLSPKLLILDEATTGLDVLVEADILKTIKEIQREQGMSILMISHDKRLTDALCDRIYTLKVQDA